MQFKGHYFFSQVRFVKFLTLCCKIAFFYLTRTFVENNLHVFIQQGSSSAAEDCSGIFLRPTLQEPVKTA